MAFDQYTGRGWKVSRNEQAKVLRRSAWNYQFQLPKLSPMGSTKEIIQTYSIVSEFTNLIPALTEPRELYFPSQEVAIDAEGGLRSPITLPSGLTYTVISDVPFRDRSLLRNAKKTYPQRIAQVYLQIPPEIAQPVRQQTQTLLAQAQRPLTSSYEQVLFLTQALKQQYNPQPILPPLAKGEDLVSAFLFKHRGGYPDQYATTLTVMLRSIGIPARLVTGLGPGDFNPFTGLYEVKNTDAYAVAEVYFPGYGWFLFDPAPGHALFPPSVEQDQTFSVLEQFWNWVAGWLPSPVAGWLSGVFAFLAGLVSRFLTLFSSGLSGVLAGVLALISFALLGWLSWNGWRSWRYYRWLSQLAPMEQLYQQMLDWLATRGFTKERSQTPLEFLQQVRQNANPTWREGIANISHAYIGWRYGAQQPDLKQIRDQLKTLRKIPIPKRQKSNGVT
jgi:protein-glutamine gamma-glutamyltransferase